MSEAKHTRPWIASGNRIFVEVAPAVGGPNPQPAEGEQIGDFNTPEQAQLAAAAPQMLEALKRCVAELDAWDYGDETGSTHSEAWYCLEAARAAIAATTGE